MATIVMYHYVRYIRGSKYPGVKGLELESFRRQLDFLGKEFNFVTTEAVVAYLKGDERLPANPCWLTFDDGYKDHVEFVLPELKKRNLQGTFFPAAGAVLEGGLLDVNAIQFILSRCPDVGSLVADLRRSLSKFGVGEEKWLNYRKALAGSSRFDSSEVVFLKRMLQRELPLDVRHRIVGELFVKYVGREPEEFSKELYMSVGDLKTLVSEGMHVGCHTYSHRWLNSLNAPEQDSEICRSMALMELIGMPTRDWVMCYPYGAYNDDTISILNRRGCMLAVTTRAGAASLTFDGRFELSRFDTNDFPQ